MLTRFNNPNVLSLIGRDLLPELFDRFKDELTSMNVPIPDPDLPDGPYYDLAAELFSKAEALPAGLVEGVLAVEELADPANKARLEQAFWDSPYELYFEPECSPEYTALRIWLHAPYQRTTATETQSAPSMRRAETTVEATEPARASAAPKKPESGAVVPAAQAAVARSSESPAATVPSEHSPEYIRRRTGKVACLPKETRERINEMIGNGVTYAEIIKALGEEGKGLNHVNLSHWYTGGYKDWLEEQKDREETGLWEEYTLDLVKQNPVSALNEATVKMATLQIRKALRAIGHASLETALTANPESYIRLLNSLSRLTTGAITCRNQRIKEEQHQTDAERQKADPDSLCVTAETLEKIEKLLRLR